MLDEGRIAVILDGLDEIPEDLRPAVLRALSQQATFRLVLLTRSAEMADAAARAMLQGAAAIELQDIDPGAAADYLTRTQLDPPPRGWQELTRRLRRGTRQPAGAGPEQPADAHPGPRHLPRQRRRSASPSACGTAAGHPPSARTSPTIC